MNIISIKQLNGFWCAIAIVAAFISSIFLTRGFAAYFQIQPFENGPRPVDADRRWREVHYVMRGRNPYDVVFAHEVPLHIPLPGSAAAARNSNVMSDLESPEGVVYPPWAFCTEAIFFWPGKTAHVAVYGMWMIIGILFIACWAALEMRDVTESRLAMIGLFFCILAFSAWDGAVVVGNNPPIVVGLVVLFYVLLRMELDLFAGLALGLAMLKPTVAGPFVLPLLMMRRWKALFAAGALICTESLLTWFLTRTDPLEMLRQMFLASQPFIARGFGPAQYLMHMGFSQGVSNVTTAGLTLIVGGSALYALRGHSLVAQFAVASLIARFWSYHLPYDDAILVFVVVYFACRLQCSRSWEMMGLFLLLIVSLWLPGPACYGSLVQGFNLTVWLLAGAAVVRTRAKHRVPTVQEMQLA